MKTILITGCSSGFGKQMCEDLASKGFSVIATMRNADQRKNMFADLNIKTQKNISIKNLDVTNFEQIQNLYNELNTEKIKIDGLINNAGYGMYGPLEEISMDKIRHQMEVNYFGLARMIQVFLPMLRKSRGKIINISSLMGEFCMPLGSVYSASKFAVEGLSEGLAYELNPLGVQVSCILPGGHRTGFIDAIKWSEQDLEKSPYKQQIKSLDKILTSLFKIFLIPKSENISRLIIKMMRTKRLSRRYYLGVDSIFAHLMRRILPDFIYYRVLNFSYNQLTK
ncbi:MAG: SDR family oxidoreductase [Bacteriovoracaceae bacterium]|jgi:short-subunit dehydrogenase|nr:SDR family oxidoreductase [Bacteriovoracaceae bacterium]